MCIFVFRSMFGFVYVFWGQRAIYFALDVLNGLRAELFGRFIRDVVLPKLFYGERAGINSLVYKSIPS